MITLQRTLMVRVLLAAKCFFRNAVVLKSTAIGNVEYQNSLVDK